MGFIMGIAGKKIRKTRDLLSATQVDSWRSALEFVVGNAGAGFDESVDVDIVLGIDPTKGEQTVRGSVMLPNGTGKKVRVVAFVGPDHEQAARDAGADFVGSDELFERVAAGWTDFDVSVATPEMMPKLGRLAKILGPRGLLPNKKTGTVVDDVSSVILDLKKGRVSFRNDKGGVLHAAFGRVSMGVDGLFDNLVALVRAVRGSKPASSKGRFLKKIVVSSTMGVGVPINPEELV